MILEDAISYLYSINNNNDNPFIYRKNCNFYEKRIQKD